MGEVTTTIRIARRYPDGSCQAVPARRSSGGRFLTGRGCSGAGPAAHIAILRAVWIDELLIAKYGAVPGHETAQDDATRLGASEAGG